VSSRRISRRALLRGAGGIAIGLPFLEIMGEPRTAAAADPVIPQRFIVFFSPDGYIRKNWVPTGDETNFQLGRSLMPLNDFKQNLIVLDGVDNEAAKHGPGDDHMRGMGSMLTGTELLPGTYQGGCCEPSGVASGISIDQKIANVIGKNQKFKSLEFGVLAGNSGNALSYATYAGSNQPLPAENNPGSIFSRVFNEIGGDQSAVDRLQAQRKSVLDAVAASYSSLAPRLGQIDKQRVDLHFSQIRDMETRLTTKANVSALCVKPGQPNVSQTYRQNDQYPNTGKLQMDLMVSALACDLTRVATIQWAASATGPRFTWLGVDRGQHDVSHDGDDNADSQEKLTKIDEWYAKQLAYLMGALKAIPEGPPGKTMLDHTLILWCNELSRGNAHSHPDMPYVLAGGTEAAPGTKKLQMGRFLKYDNKQTVKHNDMLVSIQNVFGINENTFGNPAYCSGALARL
jgi:hypothetical protein